MTTTTKQTTGRLSTVLATVLLAAGALTACSSGSAGPDTAGSTTSAEDRAREQSLANAKCLRDKGYDVSDEEITSGHFSIPDGADPDEYLKADEECSAEDRGAGDAQGPATPFGFGPEVATCLRDAGFADYPDEPASQGEYVPQDEDAFVTALDECVAEHGDGTGVKPPRG